MREFTSFGAFAVHLERLALEGAEVTDHLTESSARIIRDAAKDKIGHYQHSVNGSSISGWPDWAPLAASTEAEKARLGAPLGAPLLRHGDLYISIDYQVATSVLEGTATVGTPLEIGLYQELGTKTIPPRPFLGPAAFESKVAIGQEAVDTMIAWICGKAWRPAITAE